MSPLKQKDLMNEFGKSSVCGGLTNTKEEQECETDEEEGELKLKGVASLT